MQSHSSHSSVTVHGSQNGFDMSKLILFSIDQRKT